MKKVVLLLAIAFFGTTVSNAQVVTASAKKAAATTKKVTTAKIAVVKKSSGPTVEGAGMVFENETIDYGTIPHNADGAREFVFTNNGNKPLIITNTQGSCGCTVPTSPKDPIAPGAKGKIGVKYATDRVGAFTKTVTVTSNAEGMPSKVVTIKGTILPDPAAAIPAAPATIPATGSSQKM
ncbi:MAG: DUF1573 domain-containing protein [Flavobacterium sp.]|nr:DUF1573 domain-containing protein [Flavobacterium sp.]